MKKAKKNIFWGKETEREKDNITNWIDYHKSSASWKRICCFLSHVCIYFEKVLKTDCIRWKRTIYKIRYWKRNIPKNMLNSEKKCIKQEKNDFINWPKSANSYRISEVYQTRNWIKNLEHNCDKTKRLNGPSDCQFSLMLLLKCE